MQNHKTLRESYIEDVIISVLGDNGQKKHQLDVKYLESYVGSDRVDLFEPRLTLFSEDAPPIIVYADQGQSTQSNRIVELNGNIHLRQEYDDGTTSLEIVTDHMRVFVDRRYAETDALAKITNQRGTIDSIGFRAYLPEKHIVLDHHLKTIIQQVY